MHEAKFSEYEKKSESELLSLSVTQPTDEASEIPPMWQPAIAAD